MNNCLFLFLLCITSPLFAAKTVTTDITPVLGYRQDTIKWTTAGGSSFQWKNLRFLDYALKGKTTLRDRYVINYDLGLANLLSGNFRDNGYLIPGGPASSNHFKGWGIGFRPDLGLGYKFKPNRRFSITPQLGYAYDFLYIDNTRRTGPFSSIKNTIQWNGPWLGFNTTTQLTRRASFKANVAYHVAFYQERGNWKMPHVTAKNKMRQHGTGQGVTGLIAFGYNVARTISLGIESDVQWTRVTNGRDTRRFAGDGT